MPDILFRMKNAVGTDAKVSLVISPTSRFIYNTDVVLPDPVQVDVSVDPTTITLAPTGVNWCWKIQEKTGNLSTRYYTIPDTVGPIEFTSLTEVDPSSFSPIVPPLPPWLASVRSIYTTLARTPDVLAVGNITRNSNNAITSFGVVWPDGATGTYTADTVSTSFLGAVDAYHITHVLNGITSTYTQPLITRDVNGNVVNIPQIVIT